MIILILNLILSLCFGSPTSCKIHAWVGNSSLSNSAEFWEEYGQLAQKGAVQDQALIALIAKHTKQNVSEVEKEIKQLSEVPRAPVLSSNLPSAAMVGEYQINIKKSVQKSLDGTLPSIREKFDKMIATMHNLAQ